MIKTKLNIEEKEEVKNIIKDLVDVYGDFYITKNNYRLYIKENLDLLFNGLDFGDKIIYNKKGIAVILGFSDKSERKYLKILVKDINDVEEFIKEIDYSINIDLYTKLKKNNPIIPLLKYCGFEFKAGRGKEILLFKRSA